MKRFITAVLIITMLAGCEKNDIPQGSRLSRITVAGTVSSQYFYDNSGNLIKIKGELGETLLSYNSQNQVIKIETSTNYSNSMTPQLEYASADLAYNTEGKLIKTTNYLKVNGIFDLRSILLPEYASGRLISTTLLMPDGTPANKTVYTYSGENITSIDFYQYNSSQSVTFHTVYEYDDKKNPFINIGVPPYSVSKNNITKIIETNYLINPGKPTVTTTIITYKSYTVNGFPKLVNDNNTDRVYEYE